MRIPYGYTMAFRFENDRDASTHYVSGILLAGGVADAERLAHMQVDSIAQRQVGSVVMSKVERMESYGSAVVLTVLSMLLVMLYPLCRTVMFAH